MCGTRDGEKRKPHLNSLALTISQRNYSRGLKGLAYTSCLAPTSDSVTKKLGQTTLRLPEIIRPRNAFLGNLFPARQAN